MSILGQTHPSYNKKDAGQNLQDIMKVLEFFRDNTEKYQRLVSGILALDNHGLHWFRNQLFGKFFGSGIIEKEIKEVTEGEGFGRAGETIFDRFNRKYDALVYLFDVISRNPGFRTAFLQGLDDNITVLLGDNHPDELIFGERTDIEEEAQEILESSGYAAYIYYLGECIREGTKLQDVEKYIHKMKPETEFQKIDRDNLLSRLAFRKNIEQKNLVGKSFSLSAGISNSIAQLGYIREYLRNGGTIRAISGTSMGSIIAVLVSKVVGTQTGEDGARAIDHIIDTLKSEFAAGIQTLGKVGKIPAIHASKLPAILTKKRTAITDKEALELKKTFLRVAEKLGVGSDMVFDDLPIPIAINASYQSFLGEKEAIFSGKFKIIESLIASGNLPSFFYTNVGKFGVTPVNEREYIDFAANEQGNPTQILMDMGISPEDIICIDNGYSSTSYQTIIAGLSRWLFPSALMRDMVMKSYIRMFGKVIELDVESSNNRFGSKFSPEIFDSLVDIGMRSFQNETGVSRV